MQCRVQGYDSEDIYNKIETINQSIDVYDIAGNHILIILIMTLSDSNSIV